MKLRKLVVNTLLASVALLLSGVAYSVDIPPVDSWVERGDILNEGSPWSWDINLSGAISPSAVVKKNGIFYLYYVGADGDRSTDGGPRHRAMGVASSTDGINFTRYSNNPIITFLPNNNEEEGLFSAGAMIDDNGEVLLYYSGCDAGSATSQQVSCSGYLATSPDGLNFTEQGVVLDYTDKSVWGSGDELFPVGAFKNNGTYYLYYIAKGSGAVWDLGLASGTSKTSLTNTQAVLTSGDNIVGGMNPVVLSPTQVALFVVRGFSNWYTEVRTISPSNPQTISSTVATYDLENVYHTVHFYDSDTSTWFMYYLEANNIIRLKTTSASTSPADTLAPAAPSEVQ